MPRLLALFALMLSPALWAANPQVELRTNFGVITLELYPERAPVTVKNFLQYVEDRFYDGTIFHRVIDGFMIQGGGFTPDLKQKSARPPIPIESQNGLRNDAGTVAMARTSDPNSATAQFFINVANNEFLNFTSTTPQGWGYAVFGRVTAGTEVVEKIKRLPTDSRPPHQNVPVKAVVIETARIVGAPIKTPAK